MSLTVMIYDKSILFSVKIILEWFIVLFNILLKTVNILIFIRKYSRKKNYTVYCLLYMSFFNTVHILYWTIFPVPFKEDKYKWLSIVMRYDDLIIGKPGKK